MKKKQLISTLLILFIPLWGLTQAITNQEQQIWLGYITQSKISNTHSIWNDFHWVPGSFALGRTGFTFHLADSLKTTITAGYAFAMSYPPENQNTFRPEHRPWGQITLSHKNTRFSYFHRFRYEARLRGLIIDDHLQNEFNFNHRLRYLFQTRFYPNSKLNKKWFLMFSDEILCNAGNDVKNHFRLDQNRISLGTGLHYKKSTFQIAYMNQMIESNVSNTFKMNHNLQFLIFQNFDWRNK